MNSQIRGANLGQPNAGAQLDIVQLSKWYGSVRAVDGISLTLKAGEFLTLLGASGSGKTTTLNLVAGFQRPTSGDISLDGRALGRLPAYKRNIGVVFQSYALFPHMTVYDNVAFPLRMRRFNKIAIEERVRWALDLVRLGTFRDRTPDKISGGQQQRVALARALVFQPPLLLMDEPLAALDRALREEIQEELRDIHASLGTTIIYVTHDQEEAIRLSDRIAVMRDGRIEEVDTPERLYRSPGSLYVATFLGKSNQFIGTVKVCGEEKITVDCSGRDIGVSGRHRFGCGERVIVAVRPERISFLNTEACLDNTLDGVVVKAAYLGSEYQFLTRVDNHEILVRCGADEIKSRPKIGEAVRIGWQAEDAAGVYRDTQDQGESR